MNALIIEDHPLIILATKITMQEVDPLATICSASSFQEGLAVLAKEPIDIVILDINIPGDEDLKMIERIREVKPEVLILVYSAYDEELYAIPYLQAGANGYLSKQSSSEEFKIAVRTVLDNKKYVSDKMQQMLIDNSGGINLATYLTAAEFQVMQLLVEGKWTKEIAYILDLRQNTVSTYKRRIFDKLGVRDAIELSKKVALINMSRFNS